MNTPYRLLVLGLGFALGCDDVAEALEGQQTPGEADGRAVKLAEGGNRFSTLASDGQTVFIVQQNGEVYTHPVNGGALTKLGDLKRVIDNYTERSIVDGESLWVVGPKGLFKMPKGGGEVVKVPVGIDTGRTKGIVQTADFVFTVGAVTEAGSDRQNQVIKIDKKTLKAETLGQKWQQIGALAGDDKNLYLTDSDAGTVVKLPMDGSEFKVLASEMPRPEEIGVGPDHVYWKNSVDLDRPNIGSKLARIKKDGAGTLEVLWDGFAGPLYADAQNVWVCGSSAVSRMSVDKAHPPDATELEPTKFLKINCSDMVLLDDRVVAAEDNGNSLSDKERSQPNRVISATK